MNKILVGSIVVVMCLLTILLTSRRENKYTPELQESRYTITPTITPDKKEELYKGRSTGMVLVCHCSDDKKQCITEETESWRAQWYVENDKNYTKGRCVLSPTPPSSSSSADTVPHP